MENVKELEEKLNISKVYSQIINHIESSKCPVCHNRTLKYKQYQYDSPVFGDNGWHSEIKCNTCDVFKAEYKVSGYEYYTMNVAEKGELQMLQGCYNKVKTWLNL